MGSRIDHTCPDCGLTGHVSGGPDCGMDSNFTTTIYCFSCDKLQDVSAGIDPNATDGRMLQPRCAKRKTHPIRIWNIQEPCPRCGIAHLEMNTEGRITMWD